MMENLEQLLDRLGDLNVRLWVEAGELRFSAPKGVIQGALRDTLRDRKVALIAHLSAPKVGADKALPASVNQEMLWALDQLESDSPALYIEAQAIRIRGELLVPALEAALDELCRRHEILRSRLEMRGDALYQIVVHDLSVAVPVENAAAMDAATLDARIHALAFAPFDLQQAPLLRMNLLRRGPLDWILVFSQHHVMTDRWSIGLLIGELSLLYAAFRDGKASPLPPPVAQYADYVAWQRQRLSGEHGRKLLDYWQRELAGAPPLLALPTDRPYPSRQSYRGGRITIPLAAGLGTAMDVFSRREKATPFMIFTAAFTALLHRITGQETIVLGTPAANRLRTDLEAVPGYFVNTLALRNDVDPRASFRDLLRGVCERSLAAYEHQELPFSQLVNALQTDRSHHHPPIFQAMIVMQNVAVGTLSFGDVALTPIPLHADTGKYPLMLTILPDEPGGPILCWDFQRDLFDDTTVAAIAARFTGFLADALAAPDKAVCDLAVLTPEDERLLLAASRGRTETETGADLTIADLFAQQAAATPEATAILFGDRRLDYRMLDREAERLARHLVQRGAGAGDRIGIALDRSPELIAGLLAILKVGAVYVPLDRHYPAQRLAWMMEDSGISLLMTDKAESEPAGWHNVPLLLLNDLPPLNGKDGPSGDPDISPGINAESPAYLMYTSGSTGRPKGVLVPHRGVIRLVRGADYASFGAAETMLQLAPISFDASTLEIWGTLLNGGTLLIAPPLENDFLALGRIIREGGVTTLWLTSGLFSLMVDNALDDLQGVRQLMTGGEALSRRHAAQALVRLPQTTLINCYGPTENTTFTTCYRFPKGELGLIAVGRPIAGTTTYILDSDGKPVPPGVSGELLTGGAGLAIGYHNRPDLTAEFFVTRDLTLDGKTWSERLYRTGDLARWIQDPHGDGLVIEILGRMDQQVKIRGFRVEPGEIEVCLGALPGVVDCAVVVRRDSGEATSGEARLTAYYVPYGDARPDLRTALAKSLPDYMIPAQFVALDALPVTPNGKTDRLALASDRYRVATAPIGAPPATATETLLADIWAELLPGGAVHRDDHFFERGGNSLSAIRMIAQIRDALAAAGRHQALPIRSVFEHPTLSALASAIDGFADVTLDDESRPAARNLGHRNLPLSHAQERLWVLEKMMPLGGAYNVPGQYHLLGPLNVAVLEQALAAVISRHDALSAVFTEIDGCGVQHIAPTPFHLVARDCTAGDAPALLAAGAEAPFDLEQGPAIRANLLRVGPQEHYLQIVMHHLVCDGWSVTQFLRELETAYTGKRPLPPLTLQYQDFADWHRAWLQGPRLERLLEYWRGKLDGLPDSLELPTDFPRPAMPSNRGAVASFAIDANAVSLDQLCRVHKLSRFMLFYAAFAALLQRIAGQSDFAIGTPIAGRHHPGAAPLIGFFADNLALRTPLVADEAFTTLLARARETVLAAFEHQDLPFTTLVEALKLNRRLDTAPLFQVMLSVEDEAPFALTLPGLTVEAVALDSPYAKYDLTLTVQPAGTGFTGILEYSADLFLPETIARIGRQFSILISEITTDPEQPVGAIDLRDAGERTRRPGLMGAQYDIPRDCGLHDLIAEQAARNPAAIALSYGDTSLTYAALEAAANRLAHHLIHCGLAPGGLVGLHCQRSLHLPVMLLAILKAGGAYVPLNPAHPADRIAAVMRSARPTLVIAGPDFPCTDMSTIRIDPETIADTVAGYPNTPPAIRIHDDQLAYVMFTSGSTGTPKGVAVPHRAVINHQMWFRGAFAMSADDTLLQMTSFDFDASVIEFFAPFLSGGRLVIAPPGCEKDPAALARLMRDAGVTLFQATPALLQVMTDEHLLGDCRHLRVLISGGEILSTDLQNRLMAQAPQASLFNNYGPTEACIDAVFHACRPGLRQATVPIGQPIDNMRAYVLDADLRPVAAGIAGELFLAGNSLALGYLNEPALSATAFLPDPFADGAARMYRTGDRVRLGPNGLEFLGRTDQQVKIRGFRIETAEIEAFLNADPSVRESAVIGIRRTGDREHRLVAFVAGSTPDSGALRSMLKRGLPDYMIPAHFVMLESLPVASSGKIDRRRLAAMAEPALTEAMPATDKAPPRNDTELQLVAIWRDVLGTEAIGIHDNFFELGGHSLMAVQVVSRMRARWPVDLSVRQIFEAPTVAELAGQLTTLRAQDPIESSDARPPMVKVPRHIAADGSALMPVSYSQRALWFLDQLEGGGRAYTTVSAFVLSGELDVPALTRALDDLMRRHEALRTCFTLKGDEPQQRILPALSLPFIRKTVAESDATLTQLAMAEAARPIDLSREPPLRVTLIDLLPEQDLPRYLAVLTWHHIATDGWSTGIFVRELGAFYTAHIHGRPAALPPLPVQYADYASWQAKWLAGPDFSRQLSYWKAQLAGAPPHLNLCTDRPRPHRQSFNGATLRFQVDAALTDRLRTLGQTAQASLFMTLLSAFMVLLHRYSRQEDILVGTPMANRTMPETEGLVGFLANTLVLRGRMVDNPCFTDFLDDMRRTALDAFSHADVPFEKLVDVLDPPRSLSHAPLFQAMFNLQNTPAAPIDLPGLALSPLEIDTGTAKFDLLLTCVETNDGTLDGHWEYSTDLFDPHTARRMVDQYLSLLRAVVAAPRRRLRELALAPDDESARVVAACEGPFAARDADKTLHRLFEEAAARHPDSVAVEFAGQSLSYAQLNRRSNALAQRLISLGVRPDMPVGIRLGRSIEMIVALLGILKAGGAYLPLDPALPAARQAFIIGDAGVKWVVGADATDGLPLPHGAQIVPVEPDDESADDCTVAVSAENLVYVLYTSGSTGQPKGVLMPHRSLVNLIQWQVAEASFAPGLRTLQFTTLSFDVASQEIFATWASGGTLVLMDEALRRDVPAMISRAAEWRIQRIFLPFTALQQMAEAWPLAHARATELRELITAGERLKVTPGLRRMFQDLPACRLVNQYGPTETHVATALTLPADPDAWPELPRIGRPIANTAIRILDEERRPLPPGVPGQLWIAGTAVSHGYLGRPDLTEAAFRRDPFGPGMMYATGDLACIRWDADCQSPELDFLGRIDQQVKVRGYRIEPEEVERSIIAQGHARDVAVVAWADDSGENRLVAYYVPADAAAGDPRVVRGGLAASLPDYMIPTLWVPMAALPQTRSGKIDRAALPPPDQAANPQHGKSVAAPASVTEKVIADIWQSILQCPEIGLQDNFFDLGGYSFLLLRVLAEIRQRFPEATQITMVSLFERPTVQALAQLIDGAVSTQPGRHRGSARAARTETRHQLRDRRTNLRRGATAQNSETEESPK